MSVSPSVGVRRRIALIFFVSALMIIVLCCRLFWLQVVEGEELRNRALNTRLREIPVEAKRGTIYDRQGRELAISVNVDSIYAIPAEIKDTRSAAKALADTLGMKYDDAFKLLSENTSFVWIKRKVDPNSDAVRKLKQLNIDGIDFTQESQRYYPKGRLASHLLGFAGIDSQGLNGIEVAYDKELRGTRGNIVVEFDARGRELPQAIHRYEKPVDGLTLVLTIDEVIQFIAERELEAAMSQTKAKQGLVTVMDPSTGEILAMAARPDFDPNKWWEYDQKLWRNPVISDTFPPGSTFKPVTAAAALEERTAGWSSHYYCPGSVTVPGATIGCVTGHGSETFEDIIKYSCNVGFVQVGLALGVEKFYKYLDMFGIWRETGIDLPGEGAGIAPEQKGVKPVDLAVMSFGQTLTVTPIRLLSALSAIVNHGVMMRPHVAREFRDHLGNVVRRFDPVPERQVVSGQTADELKRALGKVVEEGTGTAAKVEGYMVGGKTGTAEKVIEGKLVPGRYIAWFFGFAPVDDPKVSVLVMLDDPEGAYYGGVIAAPVAGNVIRDTLRYLAVPPVKGEKPEQEAPAEVEVPSIVNLPLSEAMAVARESGFGIRVAEGEGLKGGAETLFVRKQLPPPGARVKSGTTILAIVSPAFESESDGLEMVRVPDVTGRSIRDTARILAQVGLRLVVEGSGLASEQSPAPGNLVKKGSSVWVSFKPPPQ